MNRLKKLFIAIALVFIGQSAFAEGEAGAMFSVTLNKRFNDYFLVNLQNHLWLDHNFTKMERYMVGVNLKTTLVKKYLYFDAFYYYRYRNKNNHSENTQRYQLGLSGNYSLPRVKFSAVSKMESNHIFVSANDPYNVFYWRNRLAVNGILKENDKISPFGAVEVFNKLNWREKFNEERGYTNKKGVELLWIDLGVDYKINKTFAMTFTVREQMNFFINKYSTMFGAACKITL